ncbi:class I SAM-dependent methyltransferase [Synechococcus sp. UW69]|uniref:class I SAM-dependent methyltransferase n=1 Tax=Synechococcus sp. UW69 TaxID=368493 RepID=UPI0010BD7A35|nr:class I SAM-dependent methyltransferase [Synechococcus sp. UW69]
MKSTQDQKALHASRQREVDEFEKYFSEFLSSINCEVDRVDIGCPKCGKKNNTLFSKNGGQYSHCNDCNIVYLNNYFVSDILNKFYINYPSNTQSWHEKEIDFYKNIFTAGSTMIEEFCNQSQIDVLDIGCSTGLFLKVFSDVSTIRAKTFGIEPNIKESNFALSQGINIIGSSIGEVNRSFDVITLWDVLEHIPDPIAYIKNIKANLKPGGLLFIQIPTCDSLSARVLREHCNMFDGIEHLTLFGIRGIQETLEFCGFEILKIRTVIDDSFAITNYMNYDNPYNPQYTSHSKINDLFSSDIILENNLGYKIQVVSRVK